VKREHSPPSAVVMQHFFYKQGKSETITEKVGLCTGYASMIALADRKSKKEQPLDRTKCRAFRTKYNIVLHASSLYSFIRTI
jgi:hypothetical protein